MPTIAIVLNWRRRPDKRVTELLIEKCLLEYVYGYYENIAGTEKKLQNLQKGSWMKHIKLMAIEGFFDETE